MSKTATEMGSEARGVEGGRGLVQCGQRPCLGVAFLTRYLSPVTEKIREIRCPGRAQGYIYVSQSVEFICVCVCVTCVLCICMAVCHAQPTSLIAFAFAFAAVVSCHFCHWPQLQSH